MSGLSLDSFQRALHRFKNDLPPHLIQQFSICTLQDVQQVCRDAQTQHESTGELRSMKRLRGFIEAMSQLGQVIEVFLNVHEIVCFIWGPVKFLLLIAKTHLDSFDKLVDAYSQVGEAIPGLLRYKATFQEHPPLATVLEDYYSDILQFHCAALAVFRRSKWQQLFHSTWNTFESSVGPILNSMKRRQELLQSEKGSATLYEVQGLRKDLATMRAEQTRRLIQERFEKHGQQMSQIQGRLQVSDYQTDQEVSAKDRIIDCSGHWVFEEPKFKAWICCTAHAILYIHGMPGSGKTTLTSTIIGRLLKDKHTQAGKCCVAYFYFKRQQEGKASHNSMLRALLSQLLKRDATTSDHLFHKISNLDEVNLRSTKTLEELVEAALETYSHAYVLLDGIDECARNEATLSVTWLLSLVRTKLKQSKTSIRLLLCGQRDGILDQLLSMNPLSLWRTLRAKQKVESGLSASRAMLMTIGMFLYARIVMENLASQTKLAALQREMDPSTFPRGIEKAYGRVAVRVFESIPAHVQDARKVMSWVASAKRPLRWREVQALSCIDPIKGNIDYTGEKLRVTCKELCGALVDVHHLSGELPGRDEMVKIVHRTALDYLIREKWLDRDLGNAELGIWCSRYLTSLPLRSGLSESQIDEFMAQGYYAFQDYAVKHWYDHLQAAVESQLTRGSTKWREAVESARALLEAHGSSTTPRLWNNEQDFEGIVKALTELPSDGRERNAHLHLERHTSRIRDRIESYHSKGSSEASSDAFINLHGSFKPYKCPKPWCDYFTNGFKNIADRKRHLARHLLPFICANMDCFGFDLGFETQSRLSDHIRNYHHKPTDTVEFPQQGFRKSLDILTAVKRNERVAAISILNSMGSSQADAVNAIYGHPKTNLLYEAVQHGHFDLCKTFLERGAHANFQDASGNTALHIAAKKGFTDIVHLLLSQSNCQPDRANQLGWPPFYTACAFGHLEVVRIFMVRGDADLHQVYQLGSQKAAPFSPLSSDLNYVTAFERACLGNFIPVVQHLLQEPGLSIHLDVFDAVFRAGHQSMSELLSHVPISTLSGSGKGRRRTHSTNSVPHWHVSSGQVAPRGRIIDRVVTINMSETWREIVDDLRFGGDGRYLATMTIKMSAIPTTGRTTLSYTSVARVYDSATGDQLRTMEVRSSLRPLLSSSDLYIATTTNESIQIWDIFGATVHRTVPVSQSLRILQVAFSQNDQILAFFEEASLQLWDIDMCSCLQILHFDSFMHIMIFSPLDRFVHVSNGKHLTTLECSSGNIVAKSDCTDSQPDGPVLPKVALSHHEFLSTNYKGSVTVWNSEESVEDSHNRRLVQRLRFKAHEKDIRSLKATPNNKWVLSGSEDATMALWNCDTWALEFRLHAHRTEIRSIACNTKLGLFATASADRIIHVWRCPLLSGP